MKLIGNRYIVFYTERCFTCGGCNDRVYSTNDLETAKRFIESKGEQYDAGYYIYDRLTDKSY